MNNHVDPVILYSISAWIPRDPTEAEIEAADRRGDEMREQELMEADRHYEHLKNSGELERRHDREAARLEMQQTTTDAWGWK